jgi:hypothetical protein
MSCALRLPTIRVVTKQANIELRATASLNIDPPDGARNIKDAKDLLSAVSNSYLWISRAGSCCIEVSFAIEGRPVSECDHLEGVAETINSSKVFQQPLLTLQPLIRGSSRFGIA